MMGAMQEHYRKIFTLFPANACTHFYLLVVTICLQKVTVGLEIEINLIMRWSIFETNLVWKAIRSGRGNNIKEVEQTAQIVNCEY